MGSAPLYATDEEILGSNPYKASAIVGVNAWSDIWTGNYTETWLSSRPALTVQPWASATFAPVAIPDGTTVTNIDFTAIVALANELNGTGAHFELRLLETDYSSVAFAGVYPVTYQTAPAADGNWYTMDFIGGVVPGDGWLSIDDGEPIDAGTLTTLLRDGFRVAMYPSGNPLGAGDPVPFDNMLRVAYLVGVCSWVGGAPIPTRLYPTDHKFRNSPRIFPPSSSRLGGIKPTGYR